MSETGGKRGGKRREQKKFIMKILFFGAKKKLFPVAFFDALLAVGCYQKEHDYFEQLHTFRITECYLLATIKGQLE